MGVAVTGHMNITAETAVLVREEIARRLAEFPDLMGVSCIARGADSVFAQTVLDGDGRLPTPCTRPLVCSLCEQHSISRRPPTPTRSCGEIVTSRQYADSQVGRRCVGEVGLGGA